MCSDNGDWETHHDHSNRDESTGTDLRIRTGWLPPDRPHGAVIDAITAARECDPIALEPLYDSVAVDALDALLTGAHEPGRSDVRVSFFHDGLAITVEGNGTVTVTGARDDRG